MSVRKALLFSFVDRYSSLVISVVSSMVIARLLAPQDLGVFSVSMALLALAMTVRDMGAGQYLVQTKELTREKIQAVWTLQASIGCGLAVLIAALAWPAASFYDEPRMTPVLIIMALSFVVTPIGSVTYAMLMREMRFLDVAMMRLASNVANAVTSIGLAYAGHGPVSLAWGSLAGALANALVAQAFRTKGMPWRLSFRGVPEVLGFGGRLAGTSIVNTVQTSFPDFIIGRTLGMTPAGLYSRSSGLVAMFSRLVTDAVFNVAVSALAADIRQGGAVKHSFQRALSYMTVLNWIFSINILLLAYPVTQFLYGSQWSDSVTTTRWLALAGAILAPVPLCTAVATAMGRADLLVRATAWTAAASLLATCIGAAISLEAVAASLCIAALISSAVWLRQTMQLLDLRWAELQGTVAHSLAVAACCGLMPAAVMLLGGNAPKSPALALVAATIGGALLMVASIWFSAHPMREELQRLLAAVGSPGTELEFAL